MPSYYLDCETDREGRDKPNPMKDKIITITFQKIEEETGNSIGKLNILKSWESSEKNILYNFLQKTGWLENPPMQWSFIPIGCNLKFDLMIIYHRTKEILNYDLDLEFLFYLLPKIDIKPILTIANRGKFKGASLDKFSNKSNSGLLAYNLIQQKKWKKLLKYIKEETKSFLEIYQILLANLPILLKKS